MAHVPAPLPLHGTLKPVHDGYFKYLKWSVDTYNSPRDVVGKGKALVFTAWCDNPQFFKEPTLVAVKRTPIEEEEFKREKDTLMQLHHQNIVRYYGWLRGPDQWVYIILERCECTLDSFLNNHTILTSGKRDLCEQLLNGMTYIHSKRVWHRDLKPQNVLMEKNQQTRRYVLKIADFGVSKQLPQTVDSTTPTRFGTDGFQARELMLKLDSVDAFRADAFSVGILLHIILARSHPYSLLDDAHDIAAQRVMNIISNKVRIEESLPQRTQKFLRKLLSPHPNKRPSLQSVVEAKPFHRVARAGAAHLGMVVIDVVEYLGGGFTSAPDKEKLENMARQLEQRVRKFLSNPAEWPEMVAEPSPGKGWFKDNRQRLYARWHGRKLPAFGLLCWIRNLYAHLGQHLSRHIFETRQQATDYITTKFPWLLEVVEDFQREHLPELAITTESDEGEEESDSNNRDGGGCDDDDDDDDDTTDVDEGGGGGGAKEEEEEEEEQPPSHPRVLECQEIVERIAAAPFQHQEKLSHLLYQALSTYDFGPVHALLNEVATKTHRRVRASSMPENPTPRTRSVIDSEESKAQHAAAAKAVANVKWKGNCHGPKNLHLAAQEGLLQPLDLLIAARVDVNATTTYQLTALGTACKHNKVEAVVKLLDANADCDAANTFGWGPLHHAARYGHDAVVDRLLRAKANVDAVTKEETATPAQLAAGMGHDESLRLLLEAKADADLANKDGWTPTLAAAYFGHAGTVELLLQAKADATKPDYSGMTPLQAAEQRHQDACARLLAE